RQQVDDVHERPRPARFQFNGDFGQQPNIPAAHIRSQKKGRTAEISGCWPFVTAKQLDITNLQEVLFTLCS
ncbi:hypothetical protein, partial [Hominenteromicrobium sp.]|uniref:hypothetical protein n=1 Tax=Hominenteromicrobium sp. TaxID=3073581 RepID=UPI003AF70B2D